MMRERCLRWLRIGLFGAAVVLGGTSAALAVTIDPVAKPVNSTSLTVTGTMDSNALVTVICQGTTVGPVVYPTDTTWNTQVSGLAEGTNTITATASSGDPPTAQATVLVDTTPPTLTVSALQDGASTNNPILNVAGVASDSGSGLALVTVAGTVVTVAADGSFSTSVTLVLGANIVITMAYDQAGNTTRDKRTITLDETAPQITITQPADNSATNVSLLTVSGSVDKTSVIQVAVNGGSPQAATQDNDDFTAQVQLAAGTNTIAITATDQAGNIATAKRTVLYDTVSPTIQITEPPQDLVTNQANYLVQGTASDPQTSVSVVVSVNGQPTSVPVSTGAFQLSMPLTVNEIYQVVATATDAAGNQASATRNITFDNIPPTITKAASTTAAGYYGPGSSVDVSLAFSEPVYSSGLTITLNSGAALTTGVLSAVTSFDTSYLVTGPNQNAAQLNVTAVTGTIADLAGNQNQTPVVPVGDNIGNKVQIVIETTPPIATITSRPADPVNAKSGSFSFSVDVAGAVTQCALDSVAFNACSSPFAFDFTNQPDGRHTFSVRGVDQAGNIGTPNSYSWTINTTPPTVSAGPNKTTNAVFTQIGTVSDTSTYTVQWSQQSGPGTITFGTPTALSTTVAASQDGQYVLQLTATDAAGNVGSATMTLTWATAKPVVSAGPNKTTNVAFTQTGTVNDVLAVTLQWSQVSGPGTITFGTPTALSTTVAASQDGQYVLQLAATDAAGNTTANTMTLTWATAKPVVSAGPNKTSNGAFTQTGTVNDVLAVTLQWSQVSGPGTITFGTPTAISTTVAASQDGQYVLQLATTDAAGNTAASSMNLTWDTAKPVVSAGANQTYGIQFTQTGSVSDSLPVTVQWSQLSGPGTVTFGTPASPVTTLTASTNGQYVLQLAATDSAGNTAAGTMTLTWDTVKSVVSAGANQTYGISFSQTGTVTDSLPVTVQWSQVSGPGTINFGTPTSLTTQVSASKDGLYVLQLTATDSAGNVASATMTLTWDTVKPVVSAGTNQVTNGTITITGSASDILGLTYQWSQASGPGTVTFSAPNSLATQVTANTNGQYVLQLAATDSAGNVATSIMTLTWDTVNPVVSAGPNQATNCPITITGTANDTLGLTYQWSTVSGPGTITFGAPTSLATQVKASQDGQYVLQLTATDAASNTTASTMTLTWDTVNPVVTVSPSQVVTNSSVTLTATATDALAMTYQWSQVGGPGTITFGSAQSLTTKAQTSADGVYTISFTATDTAGNTATGQLQFTWETTPPAVAVNPNNVTLYENNSFTWTGQASSTLGLPLSYAWSLVSAPPGGNVVFGTPTALTTTISANVTGAYAVQLTVLDTAGNSASSVLTFTWDTTPPTVLAGTGPITNSQFTQVGQATDSSPITTVAWSQVSGPLGGVVSFGTPQATTTTISATQDGVYGVSLTATDAAGNSASSNMSFTWNKASLILSAGPNRTTNATITQTGSVSDLTSYTLAWSQSSGPGTLTFSAANVLTTNITASQDGTYVVFLTATDDAGNVVTSTMNLVWDTTPPVVSAGPDQIVNAPVTQTGTASDATAMTYLWTKISGPGTVSFGSAAALTTTMTASTDGVYVLGLTATDAAGNSSTSTMNLTRDTTAPTVSTGPDLIVNSQVTVTGTASDATAMTYLWTQSSGTGTVTFGSANALTTTMTANADGVYVVRLSAVDAAGNSAHSEMKLTWDTQPPTVGAGPSSAQNAQFTQTGFASGVTGMTYQWSQQSGPGTISFTLPQALATKVTATQEGVYDIRLTATDAAGNSSYGDATITWDLSQPILSLSTLSDGSYTADPTLVINGVATDKLSGMAWVKVNGTAVTLDTSGVFSTSVTLSQGANVITTTADDQAGNQFSDTRTIIYDPTAPTITVGSPVSDDYKTNQATVAIAGTVGTQCAVAMTVSDANSPPQTLQTITNVPLTLSGNGNYLFTQTITGLPQGLSTITITAITLAGVKSSKSISVTYDNTLPVLTVDTPAGDVRPPQDSLVVSGTAGDAMTQVTVTISVDVSVDVTTGKTTGTTYTPVLVNGAYSQSVTLATKGLHLLTVQATNEAGSQTTVTRRVINAAPTGDVNGDGNVDIADALLALQVAVGLRKQSDSYLVYGDVGPLVNGKPAPDWKIDISDVVVIMRLIVKNVTLSN
jgi:hypothetical protein